MTEAKKLRALFSAAGIKCVRVLKGTGCRKGFTHVVVLNEASRSEAQAVHDFLIRIEAQCFGPMGSVDIRKWNRPEYSYTVNTWKA